MASSMKERNDKKSWAKYEKDCDKLKAELIKRREAVIAKHKKESRMKGMGLSPEAVELREVSKWFSEELKKLQKKHGIK